MVAIVLGKLGMNNHKKFWKNKKVLVTGHTGFKGSWLSVLLYVLKAKIYGYSLKPKKNFIFKKANLKRIFQKSIYGDILNSKKLYENIKSMSPSIIFHLAAQPLVVDSYKDPKKTFNTNIFGTINLLEAVKKVKSVKTVIIITTDKVYNINKNNPYYNENHPLGASDPYGTSKSCVEFITESYKKSFFKDRNISIVTARAGNVIGGGDYSENRIVPDYLKALNGKKNLVLRNPEYVRPWQYVLEPLYGYLALAKRETLKKTRKLFSAWNFAPNQSDNVSVIKLIQCFQTNKIKKNKINIKILKKKQIEKETKILRLNANKSKKILGWKNKYNLKKTTYTILKWNELTKKNSQFDMCIKFVKSYLN